MNVPTLVPQRWERRLLQLVRLDREDDDGIDPRATSSVRNLLTSLDDMGHDTTPLRLFINREGHYEVERRRATKIRTMEVGPDSMQLHDVDLEARTASTWTVRSWATAAAALTSFE